MFSSTTIASSTTMPIASTTPSSVSTLMVKPAMDMTQNAPMMDTGMASTGISVVRHSRKNAYTTSTTSRKAMKMVSVTSSSERRTYSVLSKATSTEMSGGTSFLICSSRRRSSFTMSIWLAPGCCLKYSPAMGLSPIFSAPRSFCAPSCA
jgi:hypothetical protein